MSNFLNPENGFFSFMGKAFDMFVINLLWLLLCIPLVTIVPATTALYYTVVKVIRRERSYAVKEFFRSFKRNFRQGSIFSIIGIVAALVMYIDFRYAWLLTQEQQSSGSMMIGVFLVIAFLICGIFLYLCPVLSRFDMPFGRILKSSFFMSTKHMPTTVVLLVICMAVLLGSYIVPIGIFILPVAGTLLASFLIERVFKKYMPAKGESEGGESPEKDEWYLE